MSGNVWLKQLLKMKINECNKLKQNSCDIGDYNSSVKYTVAYFKLINQLLLLD